MQARASTRRSRFAAALLALTAACTDQPTGPTPGGPETERAGVLCRANVAAGTVACSTPSTGARANLTIGGQGLNVRLASSGTSWSAVDSVFRTDVTVQNLLDQPLGTDGTTTTGVKVFFHSGPYVTGGTGTVTVRNPDGMGTFTAAGQPYFEWPGVIEPRGISPEKEWQFTVPPTVETFEFYVYVDTPVPAETSVLHWRLEGGTPVYLNTIWAMWAAAPYNVFAASDAGVVLHYDGNYWRALSTGADVSLYGLWGSAANRLWAVGELGTILYFDGEEWTPQTDPDLCGCDDFNGVWGSGPDDVWAVGSAGRIVHWDGADWTDWSDESLTLEDLYSVWGAGPDDVWAVGNGGTILHWDGASWTSVQNPATGLLISVSGSSSNDVWAVGCDCDGATAVLHWDGGEWTEDTDPALEGAALNAVWATPTGQAWVVGDGIVLHYDDGWTAVQTDLPQVLLAAFGTSDLNVFTGGDFGFIERWTGASFETMTVMNPTLNGVWAADADEVWAVGKVGTILRRGPGGWEADSSGTSEDLNGVWGISGEVWTVGTAGTILHHDGGAWAPQASGTVNELWSLWGSSAMDVLAVGDDGTILRYDGSAWSPETSNTTEDLQGVWGSGAGNVFAVGTGGAIMRWDGAAWSAMNSGTTMPLWGVWGSGPGDVYAVGDGGTVLHYDGNVGGNWTAVATPAPAGTGTWAVWGSGPNDVFVLANDGLDVIHWDGATWKTMSAFSAAANVWFYSITGTGPTNLFAVGDLGAIIHGVQ